MAESPEIGISMSSSFPERGLRVSELNIVTVRQEPGQEALSLYL